MSGIDFEKSSSGLYLPKAPPATTLLKRRVQPNDLVNVIMVVIQAVTVWVLWLTYTNTVIPSRQKDLLAEQLAQLELDKEKIVKQIADSQSHLAALKERARRQVIEISSLSNERESLKATIKSLSANEALAKKSAQNAISELYESKKNLRLAQLSLLSDQAVMVVAYPTLTNNFSITDNDDEGIGKVVDSAASRWPSFGPVINDVSGNLKKLGDSVYPQPAGESLSTFFSEKMKGFACTKPDFPHIKEKYLKQLSLGLSQAEPKATEYENKVIADGKRKGINYIVTRDSHKKQVIAFKNSVDISTKLDLDKFLIQTQSECTLSYLHKAESVLDAYKNQQIESIKKI